LEKQRVEIFNSYRLMVPQGKEWRSKTVIQAEAVKPPEGAVQLPEAVRLTEGAVRQGSPKMSPGFASSIPMACANKLSSVPTPEDDEKLVYYSSSLERMNLDGSVPTEEDFPHLDFGLKDAIF
jgi:hypothetical protein